MIRDIIVQLRNDSVGTINMGTLSIAPDGYATIWDTTTFEANAPDNFEQVKSNMAVFNENIGNSNLVMIVDNVDQTPAEAWAKILEIARVYQEEDLRDEFDVYRSLHLYATDIAPGLLSGDGYNELGITEFSDDTFVLFDDGDNTKNIQFQVSDLTTETTRTVTFPDKDITLDDASDPRDPNAHATTHVSGGSDEIDGDILDISWSPTNYSPSTSPGQVTATDQLTAHLAGIDNYFGDISYIHTATQEPSGFVNRTDSTISVNDGALEVTITPTGISYEIFINGTLITKTGSESVSFTDVEGLHYFYFNSSGVLTHTVDSSVFENAILGNAALVVILYWDADNNETILFNDERHGLMDGKAHYHFHNSFGAQWYSGGEISDISVETAGDDDSDGYISVGSLVFADEDIVFDISNGSPQVISPIAQIPIYYRDGYDGNWRKKSADDYPFIQDGSDSYIGNNGRIAYNADINALGIYFIDSTSNTVTDSSITINIPSSVEDGDYMIAVVSHAKSGSNVFTTPTGWTLIVDKLQTPSATPSTPGTSVYVRTASSEPASYTWAGTSSAAIVGAILAYRNVNSTTQLDVTTTTDTGSGGPPNPPSITPITDESLIVAIGFKDDGSVPIESLSSGYSSRYILSQSGTNGVSLGICDVTVPIATTTDPGTFISEAEEWGGITIALRPAEPSAGENWQLLEVPEENFVLYHYFATNDINEPIIGIAGHGVYANLDLAQEAALTQMSTIKNLVNSLCVENITLGTIIWQTSSTYNNTPKARPRLTGGNGYYVDFRGNQITGTSGGGGGVTSHNLLTGLSANDHPQYSFNEYDAVVDVTGNGDYISIVEAINAGAKTLWVRAGTYYETADIVVPDNGLINGEQDVTINFNGDGYSVIISQEGVVETEAVSITATHGSTTITGVGTTFTNLSPGQWIRVGQTLLSIEVVNNDTSLDVLQPYRGRTETFDVGFWAGTPIRASIRNLNIVGSSTYGIDIDGLVFSSINKVLVSSCGKGIRLKDATDVTIDSIAVSHCYGNGIEIYRCTDVGITSSDSLNNDGYGWLIDDDTDTVILNGIGSSMNSNHGINITGGSFKINIADSMIIVNKGSGINFDSGTAAATICGCLISENENTAVDIDGYHVVIDGCTIINNTTYAINSGYNTIIANCSLCGNGDNIKIENVDDCNISGNRICNSSGNGIEIINGANCIVNGNRIRNVAGDGITIDSDSENCYLDSNLVTESVINNNSSSTVFGIEAQGNSNQGDVLYHDGTDWQRLEAGTSGQLLQTQGVGANPLWAVLDSDEITNVSAITGSTVSDALESLNALIVSSGTVSGPETSTDNAIARWNGTDGYTIQDSGIIIDDSDNITGINNLTVGGNIVVTGTVDGRDISTDGSTLDSHVADDTIHFTVESLGLDGYALDTHASTHLPSGSDPLTTAAGTSITVGGTGAEGTAESFARSDHTHTLTAGTPSTVGDANAAGSSGNFVHSDHVHALGGTVGGDLSGTLPNPTVTDLTITSEEQGSILYFDSSNWVQLAPGTSGQFLQTQGAAANPQWASPSGSGDVVGPGSATDNAIARFDTTTGKLIQNSVVTIDDSGNIATSGTVDGRDVSADGSTLDSHVADTSIHFTINDIGLDGYGDVFGPGTHNDNEIPRWDGVDSNTLQSSSITIDDSGNLYLNGNIVMAGAQTVDGRDVSADGSTLDSHVGSTSNPHSTTLANLTDTDLTGIAQGNILYRNATQWVVLAPGISGQFLQTQGAAANPQWASPSGSGDVVGPGSATDNAIARFDTTTGKLIQNSVGILDDSGNLNLNSGAGTITCGNINGISITAHGSRHNPGGADAVTTAAAVAVGTANAEGSATSLARSDHTHQVTGLTISGQAQGDILYRNATAWVRLAAGTSGQFLRTQGAAANPIWSKAVIGAASSTDNSIMRWDGTGGNTAQNSGIQITDANIIDMNNNSIQEIKTPTFNGVIANGNMGASATINWTSGARHSATNSATVTISFTAPAGPTNLMLILTNGGAYTITWPGTVLWPGGTEPSWTASGVDVVSFFYDGTNYYAVGYLDFS